MGLSIPLLESVEDVRRYIFSFTAPATNRHARVTFKQLLESLDHPEAATKAIHITGTNGKGSTTAMLYNGLRAAGYRVAAYISPDVFDFRERWQVNGDLVTDEILISSACELAQATINIDPENTDLTEFEVKTLLAFLIARRSCVDFHCIEVGIGGKFDATNVIPAPVAAVITSIGADHADVLGSSIRDVAYHKVGIVKAGTGVLGIGNIVGEPKDIITDRTQHLGIPVIDVADLKPLPSVLPGPHMATNASLAMAVLRHILPPDVNFVAVENAISRTTLPGRMQTTVVDGKILLFDGAHNSAAATQLCVTLGQLYEGKYPIHAVIAHTGTHDGIPFATALAPALSSVIVTEIPDRGQDTRPLVAAYLRTGLPVAVVHNPAAALRHAIEGAAVGDVILVTGSFYLAKEINPYIAAGWVPAITTMSG